MANLVPFPPEVPVLCGCITIPVSVPFAWVLTRENHDSIAVIFSASSVWWNGLVLSGNAPPAGNHLQVLFTRAQDQPRNKMYTPDGLPRLPTPVDTRDRSNMIRVLINGTWVWFGRVIHSILFSIFFIFITLFCFLKFFFVLPYDLLLYFLSFFFNFLDHTFDSLPVFLMNGTWVWFFMVIDFSIIFSIYFIFITLIYYYFFYFLLFFIFLYFFFFIYCLTIIMIT